MNNRALSQKMITVLLIVPITIIYWAFLSTGAIQEDAFITFRTAFNLSDHGELSFNLGERHSGATSFLYPYFVALIRTMAGEQAIMGILVINSISLLISAYLFAVICSYSFGFSKDLRPFLGAAIAIAPVTLRMAVSGMEAVYVVLLFVIVIYRIHREAQNIVSLVPVILLPLIRPDAIAFSLILVGLAFSKSVSIGFRYFASTILGLVLLITLNSFLFGNIFPATMQAKSHGLVDSISVLKIYYREIALYFQSSLFSPIESKYFSSSYPLFSSIALIGSVFLLNKIWIFRRDAFFIILAIISAIWLVPGAFGLGGVIFPWYFWPSKFLYQGLFIASMFYGVLILFKDRFIQYGTPVILTVLLFLAGIQFLLCLTMGYQEMGHRASVGKYLKTQAKNGDTLYLEPAGYIPFFSEMRTIDEVGLTSPLILKYKKISKDSWWIDCVKSERPTFMVQRDHILYYRTYQGYKLTKEEREWLDENYKVIKKFEYKPEELSKNSVIQRILRLGSHSNYYVLTLRLSG